MSRPTSTVRPLSLTEELEKLEQSITLTLQEIDHNFSRAHRIVTSSILPVVEQYVERSSAVWEGSKFWKQFFEASANVSLSGVEEREEEEDASYTQSHGDISTYATLQQGDDSARYPSRQHDVYDQTDDSLLDDADISGSTPRATRPKSSSSNKSRFAEYPSPYEELKQELKGGSQWQGRGDETELPSTPGAKSRIPDMSMTPMSSPFDPTSYLQSTANRKAADPLLHRVLDKNYRIQATPHTSRKEQKTPANKPSWQDTTSPMSSPPAAVPQLHAEIFSSPFRQQYSRPNVPRTPGVSVQTPAKKQLVSGPAKKDEISWESDSDEDAEGVYRELGMSPPKTIQFSLPQSRLLQTPAREASKRIVEDLLTTAGAGFDGTDDLEDSPSMVAVKDGLDDSF
ncbi:DASH complex subunit ask1 [Cadophora gregata]|uniref:DASH complex subunit ask1 n=1 Tax=Cadophora gregata TaxID=51156 RepID=UPI0026DD902C|nr:DASH complex subunit ask1 [Cadophora gregata]KAK0102881.1 DASH complex subunit ask1 [Cadophora gregata f. sp. sojae]KAK0128980.1 DASH complex subunit ask1 [Cadophora gregata]